MNMRDVLDVFRLKRWYRNLTMILGTVIALGILPKTSLVEHPVLTFVLSLMSICLIASGNYGINEVLDADSDRHHPEKRHRAIPSGRISAKFVIIASVCLYGIGLILAALTCNVALFISVALLLVSGIVYNVPPLRLKDRAYVDFTSEALNNPIRLLVGWYAVASASHIVPVSFVLAYWFLGVFLMAAKRFGEIRLIKNKATATKYRLSLAHYTEERLIFAMIAGLTAFSYMFGALSLKYSVDLIVTLPLIVVWVIWFFKIAFEENSIVISPERIFEKKEYVAYSVILLAVIIYFFFTKDVIFGWVLQ